MSIYKRIHDNIVNSHKHLEEEWKPVGSGLERHRILPGHQGGEYVDGNCTYLTHRQHYIVHFLLWKMYGDVRDKFVAYTMRSGFKTGVPHTVESKEKLSKSRKERIAVNKEGKSKWIQPKDLQSYLDDGWRHGFPLESRKKMGRPKGYKHSEETKAKMKGSKKNFVPWNKGKKIGNKCSKKGYKHSEETKKKMSEAAKGRIPWNKGMKKEAVLSSESTASSLEDNS